MGIGEPKEPIFIRGQGANPLSFLVIGLTPAGPEDQEKTVQWRRMGSYDDKMAWGSWESDPKPPRHIATSGPQHLDLRRSASLPDMCSTQARGLLSDPCIRRYPGPAAAARTSPDIRTHGQIVCKEPPLSRDQCFGRDLRKSPPERIPTSIATPLWRGPSSPKEHTMCR